MYVKVGMKSNSEEITLSVLYLPTFDYCSIRHAIKASYSCSKLRGFLCLAQVPYMSCFVRTFKFMYNRLLSHRTAIYYVCKWKWWLLVNAARKWILLVPTSTNTQNMKQNLSFEEKKRKTYLNADQDKHKNWAPSRAASEVHRHQSCPVQHEPSQPLKLMFASCQNIFKNIFPTIGSSYTEHSSDIIFGAWNVFFSPVFPWIHSINASCMCRIKYWPCLVNILPNRCLLD